MNLDRILGQAHIKKKIYNSIEKNKLKDIAGITLIEIMIGVVISAIMMGAMYTTYSIVNSSYTCLLYTSDAADE